MEGGTGGLVRRDAAAAGQVETAIRKDPDVTGVVSVIGVTPINADAECRPARHHAALARRAQDAGDDDHRAAAAGGRRASPASSSTSSRCRTSRSRPASSRAQYQYTLTGTDAQEVDDVGATAGRSSCARRAILRDVASEAQDDGFAPERQRRSRHRRPARHLDADDQRHAERCLRPAADFDHLRAGQPVPRDPRGEAANTRTIRTRCRSSMSRPPALRRWHSPPR